MKNRRASHAGLARVGGIIFAATTIVGSLVILAIYVKAYDDLGLSDRLRSMAQFTRIAMRVVSFPLGLPIGALANAPFERIFDCEEPNDPCGVFIDWWTHFAVVLLQVVLLRWLLRRSSQS